MEKEIILKLKLDTADSVSNVEKVETAFKELGDQKKGVEQLENKVVSARGQLRKYMDQMTSMSDKGSKEYQKLAQEAGKLRERMDDARKGIEAYASDTKKLDLVVKGFTAIGSAAQIAMGGAALFGEENEEVTKSIQKLVAIQSVMNGVQQLGTQSIGDSLLVMEANAVATKVMGAAQAAYTAVVGTSTGALKVFKIALAATGIGLIILAIGALIANFKDVSGWVTNVGERFKWLKPIVDEVKRSFDEFTKGLEAMGLADDAVTKKNKELVAQMDETLEAVGGRFDFEIAKAKAAGKNTFELEQAKRAAIIETLKVAAQAIYETAILNGGATDEQKKQIKKIKKLAQSTYREITVAKLTEEKKAADETAKIIISSNEKSKKIADEKLADIKKSLDEEANLRAEAINKIIEKENAAEDAKLSKIEQEKNAVYDKYFAQIEAAKKYGIDSAALEDAQRAEISEIQKKWDDKKIEDEILKAERLAELKLELKELNAGGLSDNPTPEEMEEYYAVMDEIAEERAALELESLRNNLTNELIPIEEKQAKIELLEAQHSSKKKAIAKEENDFKKALKKQEIDNAINSSELMLGSISSMLKEGSAEAKAAAVAQATIDTYKAATGAYSSASSIPIVGWILGPIAAGLAVAAGIMNVKKIVSTKVPGGGGGGGGGGISAPSISKPTIPTEPQGQQGVGASGTSTNDLLNPPTTGGTTVTVLESDIKKATDNNQQSITLSQL
jgi:hypothetical protein